MKKKMSILLTAVMAVSTTLTPVAVTAEAFSDAEELVSEVQETTEEESAGTVEEDASVESTTAAASESVDILEESSGSAGEISMSADSTNTTDTTDTAEDADPFTDAAEETDVVEVEAAETENEGIEINETNFPDDKFRSYVSSNFDNDGDSVLSEEEIQAVTEINVAGVYLSSLQGIEYFTALETLDCSNNYLTSLDTSSNTALTTIICYNNYYNTSLNLSQNLSLTYLNCNANSNLSTLDVTKNTALTYLSCSMDGLTSLDVSQNTALEYLYCNYNNLTELDVSNLTSLVDLKCMNNKLTSLDVSQNTALEVLYCRDNALTTLDISNNTELKSLECGNNQLTELDIQANPKLTNCAHDSDVTIITNRDISDYDISLSDTSFVYTGEEISPTITVLYGTEILSSREDYDVAFSNNINVGTATVTITGKGLYGGTAVKTFSIVLDTPVLSSISNTASGIKISWNEVTNAEKYRVYRKTADSSWKRIKNTSSTSYTDTTAVSGTTYYYTVRCITSDGTATTSGYDSTGLSITYIAAPTLSAVSNTASGVKVTWEAPAGGVNYRVFRKTSNGSWKKVGDTTSTSYTDTTGKSGTTYYYTVRCIDSEGTSYTSSYDSTGLSIKYLSCGTISKLTNTTTGIKVTWDKVTGASGYYLYRKTSSGTYKKIKTITSGSTVSYTDTAVSGNNGTTYLYAVKAYSGSTTSSYKSKTTVRLTTPTLSSVSNSSSKKMTVKWAAVSGVTGYQIMYSTSSDFSTYTAVKVSGETSVSKVISGLTKGENYYVRIRTYKTVSGTTYASGWTSKKSVTISK